MTSKIAMIAITATFIANIAIAQSIKTIYPTKDWVIADFVVTDPNFGAKAQPGFDNRAAFQAAIDSAYKNGGGVVYIPAGNYEFRSTQTATRSVRVRQGAEVSDGSDGVISFESCTFSNYGEYAQIGELRL